MSRTAIAYISILVVFAAMDFCCLSATSATLYKPALGPLLSDKVQIVPAVLFYLIYLGGLVYFAVLPALQAGSWSRAAINGALLGLVAYATYDLTNQATLRIWSTRVTLMDLCWGAFASAVAASASFAVTTWANRAIH